ncbi:hypothetical protein ABB37_04741 [Leptomonas pyrrhocoris]|uniref:UBA domain-containing protein n=1 Tax=Leptomonas pyrrhocoris TaxID=157538 RepID=A0A0N0DVS5_LEPPY|nr:hypothetical protein ABB37_04741 [Leptomonas pyrrhocoris]KPA80531.1 hypothetical protein ABB37_04741 [Leptomonas pyrrhocoris]|eukprot:XP_015658970.1 hypothetical protein ABB37_04741 [Leptomonas pyrrhocoris]
MRFTVTCLVSSVNSSLLSEAEAVTKEIVVANPRANVQSLRAIVAIQFRLNVVAFEFRFDRRQAAKSAAAAAATEATAEPVPASSSADSAAPPAVDFSDERKLLMECGLADGDHLTVVPKNYRPSADVAMGAEVAVTVADGRAAKKPRTEEGEEGGEGELGDGDEEESLREEDSDSDSDADSAEHAAQNDLFEALRDVVPDLTVLRNEFLANPQAVMERIERNHASLFQVITQNQETFINLMNNEQLTKAAQSMLHGGPALGGSGDSGDEENSLEWSMGEEDEEMDEETEAQMNALFQNYIASGGAGGDFDAADLAALEASGMEVGDVDEAEGEEGGSATAGGSARKSEKDFLLSRVPSEEDEKKIQALTELGFTYEQCKVAFYMCHRSIDRASNMLFEAPPEL